MESHSNLLPSLSSCFFPTADYIHHCHQCGRIARFLVSAPNPLVSRAGPRLSSIRSLGANLTFALPSGAQPASLCTAARERGFAFFSIDFAAFLSLPVAFITRCLRWIRESLCISHISMAVSRLLISCYEFSIGTVFKSFWHTMTSDDRR